MGDFFYTSLMKVLVLGDGRLGQEIINQTGWDLLSRKKDKIDIHTFPKWMWKLEGYDVVLNCIANTDTYSFDYESIIKTNYEFVTHLVRFCDEMGIKLVHISTDYVYTNSGERASETTIPVPDSSWYSLSKVLADEHIKLFSNDYLICRLSHKPKPFPYDSAWTDVKTNADYTDVISSLVIQLIRKGAKGLYNVGTEEKTIYELAKQTNPNVAESLAPPHIPKNVTMDITKMKKFLEL
jgi:dTDP-4-dehydrorhamnose reductase